MSSPTAELSEPSWVRLRDSGLLGCALRVSIEEVAFFRYLFESYKEMAVVRTATTDSDGTAIIVILCPPEFRDDADAVLADLAMRGTARAQPVEMPPLCGEDWFLLEWGEAGADH